MLENTRFGIDWLSLTVHARRDQVDQFASLLGFDVLTDAGHGSKGFAVVEKGLHGFKLMSCPGGGRDYCTFVLPGDACDFAGVSRLEDFFCAVRESGFRFNVSRIDLAFDTQAFKAQWFARAWREGAIDTSAREAREVDHLSGAGYTFYLGSRQSESMLRVYNKLDGYSFGNDPFTRVELELKGGKALSAAAVLFAMPHEWWVETAGGWLLGFINVNKRWFHKWVSGLSAALLRVQRKAPTIESIKGWIKKQVAPSLALVTGAVSGGDVEQMTLYIRDLLSCGLERLNRYQENMMGIGLESSRPKYAVFSL